MTSQLAAVQQDLDKSQKAAVQVTELTQQQADLTKAATDQQAQVATVQQQVQTVTVQLTDAQARYRRPLRTSTASTPISTRLKKKLPILSSGDKKRKKQSPVLKTHWPHPPLN